MGFRAIGLHRSTGCRLRICRVWLRVRQAYGLVTHGH